MADGRFDYFVILAEMRTGSNALAATLNLFDGISCLGEVFNPAFVGGPSKSELFGMDIAARERDPLALLERIKRGAPLRGFRFFHDHDPRVLDALLPDPRCAKIVLSRDPVEAYVSRKIAETTGQWLLTDARDRKRARIRFDAAEYEAATAKHTAFQARVRRALQSTGQTAFPIDH
ncbi:MAG: nodulation protein NodH, partial [Pseudomonadota bacterium]